LLTFDEGRVYGVKAFAKRRGHSPEHTIGDGYELFADDVESEPLLQPHTIGRDKSEGFVRSAPPVWSKRVPIRVSAMAATNRLLFCAGVPDEAPEKDPLAAFEGRRGAWLYVVAKKDGTKLFEQKLDAPIVFDGLIASQDRIYFSTETGNVVCMGKK
jgi:hypothetical protein